MNGIAPGACALSSLDVFTAVSGLLIHRVARLQHFLHSSSIVQHIVYSNIWA